MGPIDDYLDILKARFDGRPQTTTTSFDFNSAGPQTDYYRDLIENGAQEGERSEKFQETVWHLASAGWTAEQITDELAKHPNGIGLKYANRLPDEVTRSFSKWQSQRRASATGSRTANATPWPQIRIIPGEIPRVVNEAEDALLLLGREIHQRGGMVVRPILTTFKASKRREIEGWHLIPLSRPYLVDTFTCAAQFTKYNGRAKAWTACDAPDKVAEIYLARQGRWKLPMLSGIIHTPFLRTDGSICETPGYDAESGLLFKADDQSFPAIPQSPGKADAVTALEELEQLISSFPFVTAADRSVALSALLTVLDRRSMATAPLHAFTSPAAGTGKSLLVDIAAILATGRPMPVIAQGHSEEELEKRLGAALLAGDTAISLDNCDHVVESAFLCQVLTQPKLNIRLLGHSRNIETPVNATLFATCNNLTIGGDAIRRSLLCSMDAGCERPELRVFNTNIARSPKLNAVSWSRPH
jgi:putative DNA primase/helicase